MKIALCLSGLSSGTNNKNNNVNYKIGYEYFKKNIIDENNEVDIFIHTWNNNDINDILLLYNPKKYIIDNTIMFFNNYKKYKKECSEEEIVNFNYKSHSTKSRWYSCKKVLELKQKYEEDNNFKYDFVMNSRFDIAFQQKLNFKNYNNNNFYIGNWCTMWLDNIDLKNYNYFIVEKILNNNYTSDELNNLPKKYNIIFNKIKEKKNIKISHKHVGYFVPEIENNNGKGLIDYWFFSNSKNIDILINCYDYINIKNSKNNHGIIYKIFKKNNLLTSLIPLFHIYTDFPLVRHKFI